MEYKLYKPNIGDFMSAKFTKNALILSVVTFFVNSSFARQLDVNSQAPQQLVQNFKIQSSLNHLPLILDTRNLNIEKYNSAKVENIDLSHLYGPGTSGGGNLCAYNITTATAFILKHLSVIPFQDQNQRQTFLKTLAHVQFLQGENLFVRGQSVDAINYPDKKQILLTGHACDQLSTESVSSYSLLLHEYLGVAGIDDRTYQISNRLSLVIDKSKVNESSCSTDGCVFQKHAQVKVVLKWVSENDDCENAVSWLQSFRKISNSRFEIICGDSTDRRVIVLETKPLLNEMAYSIRVVNQKSIPVEN